MLGPLEPLLIQYMKSSPLELTSANPVVIGAWGTVLAIAMLFLVAKIPDLLSRFPSMAVTNSQGIGHVISTSILAARLLAG